MGGRSTPAVRYVARRFQRVRRGLLDRTSIKTYDRPKVRGIPSHCVGCGPTAGVGISSTGRDNSKTSATSTLGRRAQRLLRFPGTSACVKRVRISCVAIPGHPVGAAQETYRIRGAAVVSSETIQQIAFSSTRAGSTTTSFNRNRGAAVPRRSDQGRRARVRTRACALALAMSSCINVTGDCENVVKHEQVSPDGGFVVTVYERTCGATTDFSTQVQLRPSRAPFEGVPDGAGAEKDGIVFIASGQLPVEIRWIDSRRLVVGVATGSERVSRRQTRWNDVTVSYGDSSQGSGG